MKTGMKFKIPRAVYLDPHPISVSTDVTNSLGFVKQSYKGILPIQLKVNQLSLAGKPFFSRKFQIAYLGGGLDPTPIIVG